MSARLSYDLSCARLRELGLLSQDDHAPMPERLPRSDDDEPLGFNVFRMRLADALDLSNLTLPRTFFGRSEINQVSFRNSDLHESNLCWNDFLEADFSGADLARSDMRSSQSERVVFVNAKLDGADLRRSSFVDCDFDGAAMTGVALAREQGGTMHLSETQNRDIDWRDDVGPEPDGG